MVTTGNEPALPDLAPSTNALSPGRSGWMHGDGARPGSRECGAIGKSLSYLTWYQWMARTLRKITLHNWLFATSPACANLPCVAGPDPAIPAAVYHLRGSDSRLSSTLAAPSLTSLTTSSVPSFISCVRQLATYLLQFRYIT